jgi:hypothetical protein
MPQFSASRMPQFTASRLPQSQFLSPMGSFHNALISPDNTIECTDSELLNAEGLVDAAEADLEESVRHNYPKNR